MIVASGTRDAIVLLRLKMSKQMKMRTTSTPKSRHASSFATAELTSWNAVDERGSRAGRAGDGPSRTQ